MNVLFVSSGNSFDGISSLIFNQGKSISRMNVNVDYFSINGKGFKSYFEHIFKLRQYLTSKKYDIIHAHYGLCGLVAYYAKRKEKLVVSFMGDDILGSNNFQGKVTLLSRILRNINIIFCRLFYDHVIVKTKEMSEIIDIKSIVSVIPNGVDLELFKPIDRNIAISNTQFNKDRKIILFASNPGRPEKNYLLARESVERLNDEMINMETVFKIKADELVYYYNAADVLLLTSFHEGSPNVIKEAMACNCPIVSTNVGDVKWIFNDTEGCYITTFSTEEVSICLKKALEGNKRTTGRKRIIELRLDADSIANRIIDIYKNLLREN